MCDKVLTLLFVWWQHLLVNSRRVGECARNFRWLSVMSDTHHQASPLDTVPQKHFRKYR
jgi:hypothetical protein